MVNVTSRSFPSVKSIWEIAKPGLFLSSELETEDDLKTVTGGGLFLPYLPKKSLMMTMAAKKMIQKTPKSHMMKNSTSFCSLLNGETAKLFK